MENINKLLIGIIGLWITLAIIFAFLDLEISKYAVSHANSRMAELGKQYGTKFDDPLFFLGITILVGSIFNDIKMQKKVGLMMILYNVVYLEYSVLIGNENDLFIAGVTIIFLLAFLILAYNKNWREYIPIAVSLILLIIILDITVDSMKIIWGRVRFNHLSSEAKFTEWYIINGDGYDGSNQSFPSGHTSAAWSFLPLLFLVKNKKIDRKVKIMLVVSVLGFGLFIAISRVLSGDHYASDVLFSTGIASLITIFLYKGLQHLELSMKKEKQNLSNKLISLIYSDLANKWVGYYLSENGRKRFIWFETYEDAIPSL